MNARTCALHGLDLVRRCNAVQPKILIVLIELKVQLVRSDLLTSKFQLRDSFSDFF